MSAVVGRIDEDVTLFKKALWGMKLWRAFPSWSCPTELLRAAAFPRWTSPRMQRRTSGLGFVASHERFFTPSFDWGLRQLLEGIH